METQRGSVGTRRSPAGRGTSCWITDLPSCGASFGGWAGPRGRVGRKTGDAFAESFGDNRLSFMFDGVT